MKKFMATIVAVATMTACTISANAVKEVPYGFTMADVVRQAKEVELNEGGVTYSTPVWVGDGTIRYWIAFHNGKTVFYQDDRMWYGDVALEEDCVLGYAE